MVFLLLVSACSTTPRKTVSDRPAVESYPAVVADDVIPEGSVAVGVPGWESRLEDNPLVQVWLGYFQGRGRRYMEVYLARSTRYLDLMKGILRQNGLPEDLVYIPMIESGYSFSAKSHASAVGYWQFIKGTGKRYGLTISRQVDERRDPILSTHAAAQYLKGLYSLFGSWELAMAAYNVGENRVQRVLMNNYTRDFWEMARRRLLPDETLNYVPKFVAAALIAKNPEKYGFSEIEYYPPFRFSEVTVDKPVNLRRMAANLGLPYSDFKMYNPAFRGDVAPLSAGRKVTLRVPAGQGGDPSVKLVNAQQTSVQQVAVEAQVSDSEKSPARADVEPEDYFFYRVRRGDNMFRIAQRYGVSQADLVKLNNLRPGQALPTGKRLKIPSDGQESNQTRVAPREPSSKRGRSERAVASAGSAGRNKEVHIVRRGESLRKIARKYGLNIRDLKKANGLTDRDLLAGERLQIPRSAVR